MKIFKIFFLFLCLLTFNCFHGYAANKSKIESKIIKDVYLEGWRVYISKKDIELAEKKYRTFEIYLTGGAIGLPVYLVFNNGKIDYSFKYIQHKEDYYVLLALPQINMPLVLQFIFKVGEDEFRESHILYPKVYRMPDNLLKELKKICQWYCVPIFSEKEQPEEIIWKELVETYKLFLPIFYKYYIFPYVYLTESKNLEGDNSYESPRFIVGLPLIVILPQAYIEHKLTRITLIHELLHAVFYILTYYKDRYALQLISIYKNFMEVAGVSDLSLLEVDGVLENQIENHKLFQLIKESNYLPSNLGISPGHPHDSATELFASIITIRLAFSDEFSKNVCKSQYKDLINEALDEIESIFEEFFIEWNLKIDCEGVLK